jgi:predicted RNase H-like HicB family nuclease
MSRYLVVIEGTATGYSAYLPDVPGCVATGATREEVERHVSEALRMHLDGLRADGLPAPEPRSTAGFVSV